MRTRKLYFTNDEINNAKKLLLKYSECIYIQRGRIDMATLENFRHRLYIKSMLIFIIVLTIFVLKISTSSEADNNSQVQHIEKQVVDPTSNQKAEKVISSKMIVYYFYTTHRCYSCRMIEQYTKDAIEQFFKEQLKSGLLEFKPLNIEKKENEHFIKDYNLYTKSVIISLIKDGKEASYKNLEKIWEYLKDENKFFNYIKVETEKVLQEAK